MRSSHLSYRPTFEGIIPILNDAFCKVKQVLNLPAENVRMVSWLLVIHIFGFVFWISSGLVTFPISTLMQLLHEPSEEGRKTLAHVQRIALRAFADPGPVDGGGRDHADHHEFVVLPARALAAHPDLRSC